MRGGIGAYAGEAHDEAVVGGDFAGGFEFVGIKENKTKTTKTTKTTKSKKQMKNKERQQVDEESIDSTNSLNCLQFDDSTIRINNKIEDMLFAKLQILTMPFPLPVMILFVYSQAK